MGVNVLSLGMVWSARAVSVGVAVSIVLFLAAPSPSVAARGVEVARPDCIGLAASGTTASGAVGTAPVAQVDTVTGVVSFLHGDVVGSTREVTDTSGGVVAEFDYGMYGSRDVVSGDADATSFLFAGEYVDPAGMYYLRSREFDPRSGVFLSVDPVLSATGMPYAYTAGNPLQGTDPLGLYGLGDLWDDAGSVAGGVWEEVSSPEFLVSAVVGIGCVAVFGPTGVVGCAAAAGAVYNAMDYSLNTPAECQSLGGYFKTVAIGAAEGYLVGVVTGPFARPIAGVVNRVLGPLLPSVMRESVSSVLQPAKNALQRLGSALKPQASLADDAPSLKSLASEVREAGLHPAARNNRAVAIGMDGEGNLFAGSSNGFDAGQRAALERLRIARVPGSGALHAEEELLRGVPRLQRVGTSVRMPCGPVEHNCAMQLAERGVGVE